MFVGVSVKRGEGDACAESIVVRHSPLGRVERNPAWLLLDPDHVALIDHPQPDKALSTGYKVESEMLKKGTLVVPIDFSSSRGTITPRRSSRTRSSTSSGQKTKSPGTPVMSPPAAKKAKSSETSPVTPPSVRKKGGAADASSTDDSKSDAAGMELIGVRRQSIRAKAAEASRQLREEEASLQKLTASLADRKRKKTEIDAEKAELSKHINSGRKAVKRLNDRRQGISDPINSLPLDVNEFTKKVLEAIPKSQPMATSTDIQKKLLPEFKNLETTLTSIQNYQQNQNENDSNLEITNMLSGLQRCLTDTIESNYQGIKEDLAVVKTAQNAQTTELESRQNQSSTAALTSANDSRRAMELLRATVESNKDNDFKGLSKATEETQRVRAGLEQMFTKLTTALTKQEEKIVEQQVTLVGSNLKAALAAHTAALDIKQQQMQTEWQKFSASQIKAVYDPLLHLQNIGLGRSDAYVPQHNHVGHSVYPPLPVNSGRGEGRGHQRPPLLNPSSEELRPSESASRSPSNWRTWQRREISQWMQTNGMTVLATTLFPLSGVAPLDIVNGTQLTILADAPEHFDSLLQAAAAVSPEQKTALSFAISTFRVAYTDLHR